MHRRRGRNSLVHQDAPYFAGVSSALYFAYASSHFAVSLGSSRLTGQLCRTTWRRSAGEQRSCVAMAWTKKLPMRVDWEWLTPVGKGSIDVDLQAHGHLEQTGVGGGIGPPRRLGGGTGRQDRAGSVWRGRDGTRDGRANPLGTSMSSCWRRRSRRSCGSWQG